MPKKKVQKNITPEAMDLSQFVVDIHSFLNDESYLSTMATDERRTFLRDASQVFDNPAFARIVNELMNIQAAHSILQAPTSQLIMFDRAGINVLKLLKDEFKKLDGMYKEMVSPDDSFDEDEVI